MRWKMYENIKQTINNIDVSSEVKDTLLLAVTKDESVKKEVTKKDIMAIQDSKERQKAIKENLHLF